jgi:cytoskeletal protein CcmA (bactofilin family)
VSVFASSSRYLGEIPEMQHMNILARNNKIDLPDTPPVSTPPPPIVAPRAQEQHSPISPRPQVTPSIFSAALTVIGRLESAGDIQIDGKVEGDIRGQGVKIGSTAVIKGAVVGEVVELAGTLEGKIEAKSAVLAHTARMSGDIIHQSLKIDQGAYFNGVSRPHAKVEKTARTVEVAPPLVLTGSDA